MKLLPAATLAGPACVRWHQRTAIVTLAGELDHLTAAILSTQLDAVLARQPAALILDMSRLAFIDCSGLTPIARARRALPPDSPLVLRSPGPQARRLLAITGFDQICRIDNT